MARRWMSKTSAHSAFIPRFQWSRCTLDIGSKGRLWLSVNIVFTCGPTDFLMPQAKNFLFSKYFRSQNRAPWRRSWCLA